MKHPALSMLAALAILCLASGTAAQPGQSSSAVAQQVTSQASTPAQGRLVRSDRKFLEDAAHAGLAEVEAGKLAKTKATDNQLKSFATQMVDDHAKTQDDLAQLASAKGVKLPTEPSLAQKAKLKMLSTRDGASFDKDYAEAFGAGAHRSTVKLFKKAAAGARDDDVKAFAQKTLPALQHHLEMAESLKLAAARTATAEGKKAPSDKK